MKKSIITAIALAIIACVAAVVYFWTTDENKVQEETANAQETPRKPVAKVENKGNGKALIVYFSVPETDGTDASSGASRIISDGKVMGNTQYVATIISEATGGDLFEIKTEGRYPSSHKALIEAAKQEIDSNARPKLTTHIENIEDYDVVFVGFPNWWYDMPMPLYSFFDEYDLSGKTVIPFCTHGGSRFSDAMETICQLEKDATIVDGHAIARDQVADSKEEILEWLTEIGMKK